MINDCQYKNEHQTLLVNVWEEGKCEVLTILSAPEMRAICLKQVLFASKCSGLKGRDMAPLL